MISYCSKKKGRMKDDIILNTVSLMKRMASRSKKGGE